MEPETPITPVQPMNPVQAEDKTVAIIAYLTIIGFVVAAILYGNNKTQLGAFHLRQALGFVVLGFCSIVFIIIPIIGWILLPFYGLAIFVLWIIALLGAVQGEMKPIPVVGPLFQQWFATIF